MPGADGVISCIPACYAAMIVRCIHRSRPQFLESYAPVIAVGCASIHTASEASGCKLAGPSGRKA